MAAWCWPVRSGPTVAAQRADPGSLLHLVARLIALRKQLPALRTGGAVDVLHAAYPFVYVRGGTHLVVINPRREPASFTLPWAMPGGPLIADGVSVAHGQVRTGAVSCGVFETVSLRPGVTGSRNVVIGAKSRCTANDNTIIILPGRCGGRLIVAFFRKTSGAAR